MAIFGLAQTTKIGSSNRECNISRVYYKDVLNSISISYVSCDYFFTVRAVMFDPQVPTASSAPKDSEILVRTCKCIWVEACGHVRNYL